MAEELWGQSWTQNSNTHRGLILLFSPTNPSSLHLSRYVWKHCCGIYMSRNIGCISRLHGRKDRLDTSASTFCHPSTKYRASRVLCTPLAKQWSILSPFSLSSSSSSVSSPNFSYLVDALPTHPPARYFPLLDSIPRGWSSFFERAITCASKKGVEDTGEVVLFLFHICVLPCKIMRKINLVVGGFVLWKRDFSSELLLCFLFFRYSLGI